MEKIKVLIVDDAMLIRRLVADALAADPAIEVVGDAANGRIALQKIAQLAPDLVTLDIEMPEMDGLATLRELRKIYPRLPVIMFSASTERGAALTLEALQIGASDYVTKPARAEGKAAAQQSICQDLIPKIRSLCRLGTVPGAPSTRPESAAPVARRFTMRPLGSPTRADIVAIALSTGGPHALSAIFPALPADFPVPIVLVQHMPNVFTRFLAERLDGQTPMTVIEAAHGQTLEPGTAYVAPGDFHLTLRRDGTNVIAQLGQEMQEHTHRPSADALFRSVAEVYGARALGVVLTGMGDDGLRGSEAITTAGGRVIVQDEATSTVWEMPGRVVSAGLADAVLPIGNMAAELIRRTTRAAAALSGEAR